MTAATETKPAPTGRSATGVSERIAASVRSEVGLARIALGVVALHVVDDNFLQPNPGTSAADHLPGGLIQLGLLVGAAVAYGRVRAGARAVIALFVGFFGVLASTEAFHYTTTVGASGDDYTGWLSAAAGLILLGVGAVTLWRSRKTHDRLWWRYVRRGLLAGAALVTVALVLFPIALTYVVTHTARSHVPAADLGAPYEDVEFTTSDGLRLRGWYIESRNGAAVISFPGRAASQKRAKMLARHGYGVLLFDRRGEGESEGDPNLFGWQGERDVHAAVEFLHRRGVDPQRIGAIGLSVGGEVLIEAAAESNDLRAVVSEGASARSVREDFDQHGVSPQSILGLPITLGTALFTSDLPPDNLQSLVARTTPRPMFFIYAESVRQAEKPANDAFYAAARGPKEIWEVPGSRHMGGIDAQPKEYEKRVVGFFDRALLG